jgi:hypothetical protein
MTLLISTPSTTPSLPITIQSQIMYTASADYVVSRHQAFLAAGPGSRGIRDTARVLLIIQGLRWRRSAAGSRRAILDEGRLIL